MKAEDDKRTFWLGKLANLNVAKTLGLGVAPHKPLMIFSVMDLVEIGVISDPWVAYDADLVTRFRDYWDHVVERRMNQPEITMPFNALGSERDRIWKRFDENGNPSKSKLTTRLCRLDPDLFACILEPEFRLAARRTMVAAYFTPPEQAGLCARFGIPIPDTAEMAGFAKDRVAFKESQRKGRAIGFRAEVGSGYRYTCALTGRFLQCTSGYIVQACHIHQHARSGNDDPRNGLTLTPDAHWMFDKGLWTVEPQGHDFIIRVAGGHFQEGLIDDRTLLSRHGDPLVFHPQARLRPGAEFLEWHRKSIFKKAT